MIEKKARYLIFRLTSLLSSFLGPGFLFIQRVTLFFKRRFRAAVLRYAECCFFFVVSEAPMEIIGGKFHFLNICEFDLAKFYVPSF